MDYGVQLDFYEGDIVAVVLRDGSSLRILNRDYWVGTIETINPNYVIVGGLGFAIEDVFLEPL